MAAAVEAVVVAQAGSGAQGFPATKLLQRTVLTALRPSVSSLPATE